MVSFIGIARALSRMHATIKGEPMAKFARLLIEKAIKHPREPNATRLPSFAFESSPKKGHLRYDRQTLAALVLDRQGRTHAD